MIIKTVPYNPTNPFNEWRRDIYSQSGEDGIIENLLNLIGIPKGYFVEFGAWDGKHLSNCAKLADDGWAGCFIEGNAERFKELSSNYIERPRIVKLNTFVQASGPTSLDNILTEIQAPTNFEILSIDIDGNDFYVWEGLKKYSPKIVIVEFNPSIPASVVYVQDNDDKMNRGASLTALFELAENKDYALVAATDWNAFFMKKNLVTKFNLPTYTPAQVKSNRYEAAIFHGFDGTLIVAGETSLIWHGIQYKEEEIQILPVNLRKIPIAQPQDFFEALQAFKAERTAKEIKD